MSGFVPFFRSLCFIRVNLWPCFLLRLRNAILVFVTWQKHKRDSVRLQNRRQRDFYALGCGAQLGAQEFALADADGVGLLRDRVDGHRCVAIRYRAVRCGGDAFLAAAMRRDDRRRHCHLQNGAGGETNL